MRRTLCALGLSAAAAAPKPHIVYLVIGAARRQPGRRARTRRHNARARSRARVARRGATWASRAHASTQRAPTLPLPPDDWGWANFGPHRANFSRGNDEFPTPNLAALAAEGVLLDRVYGESARDCSAARRVRRRAAGSTRRGHRRAP